MPRVPTIESRETLSPEADTRGTVAVSPKAFGADVGQALGTVAGTVGLVAERQQRIKDENDANKALEMFNDFGNELRGHLYDPETGMYSKKSGGAIGVVKDTVSFFDDQAEISSGELANDSQKEAFRALIDNKRKATLNGLARHQLTQFEVFKQEMTATTVKGAVEDASNDFNNPETIDNSKIIIRAAINANSKGKPAETVQDDIDTAISVMHESVIVNMADNNPVGAKDYFNTNKGEIVAGTKKTLTELINKNAFAQTSQSKTDEIIAGGGTLTEMTDKAKKINNPDMRDDVTKRVKTQFNAIEESKKIERERLTQESWNELDAQINAGAAVDVLLKTANEQPTHEGRVKMREYVQKMTSGQDAVTNWGAWSQLVNESVEDPKKFMSRNIYDWKPILAESEFKKLVDTQAQMKKGRTVNTGTTRTKAMQNTLKDLGIDFTTKKGSDAKKTTRFMRIVGESTENMERELGRELTFEEFNGLMDNLVIEGEVEDTFFNDTKLLFEVEEGEDFFIVDVDEVPTKDVSDIKDFFQRKHNRQPTGEEIIDLFNFKLSKRGQ